MRFKTSVRNITTFIKLTASLSSIGRLSWLRLSSEDVRFVISTPESHTQVWATLSISTLFNDYRISSAAGNVINLEVPLPLLHRALRSCASATDVTLRLTKRANDGVPVLCLTITTASEAGAGTTLVTQEVPVRVLSAQMVESIQEPQAPHVDVHVFLPPLSGVRSIAERFIKLGTHGTSSVADGSRIVVGANLVGGFKMRLEGAADVVKVESVWRDLQNPVLEAPAEGEASKNAERNKEEWAEVRVDGREWVKVLRVGQVARRVVAAVCEDRALVLYVFLTDDGDADQTVLTYYMSSFSA